jgi:PAS domain S-box-containing protein
LTGGGLADRFLTSQRELASQRQSFSDLRAFSDVILQSAGTGLVALDRDHRILAFNRAAEAITGVASSVAVGARWAELFGGGLPLDVIEATANAAPATSTRHEIDLRRPDGLEVPLRVTGSRSRRRRHRLGRHRDDACRRSGAWKHGCARPTAWPPSATWRETSRTDRNPLASPDRAVEALPRTPRPRPGVGSPSRRRESGDWARSSATSSVRSAVLAEDRAAQCRGRSTKSCALASRLAEGGVKVGRELPFALWAATDREQVREALWSLCLNAVAAMPAGGGSG